MINKRFVLTLVTGILSATVLSSCGKITSTDSTSVNSTVAAEVTTTSADASAPSSEPDVTVDMSSIVSSLNENTTESTVYSDDYRDVFSKETKEFVSEMGHGAAKIEHLVLEKELSTEIIDAIGKVNAGATEKANSMLEQFDASGIDGTMNYVEEMTVNRADDKIISIFIQEYIYSGNDVMMGLSAINIDPKTGEFFDSNDIISSDEIIGVIVKELVEQNHDISNYLTYRENDEGPTVQEKIEAAVKAGNLEVSLTSGAAIIYIDENFLGTHNYGNYQINLPYSEYSELLNERFFK